jgi:HEPN domain-containing protein
MNDDLVREWVKKAEHDYESALILFRNRKTAAYDVVCFLCQQCVEKMFKAFLIHVNLKFLRTHDLDSLRKQATTRDSEFVLYQDLANRLNTYSVDVRYPGDEPDRKEADRAIKAMKEIRTFVRGKLKGI